MRLGYSYSMRRARPAVSIFVSVALVLAVAGCGKDKKKESVGEKQTTCPVTGQRCDEDNSIVIEGYRIYTCCPACIPSIKARPKFFIDKIRAKGQEPEKFVESPDGSPTP